MLKVLILGNCQGASIANLMSAMAINVSVRHVRLTPETGPQLVSGKLRLSRMKCKDSELSVVVPESDLILLQGGSIVTRLFDKEFPQAVPKVRLYPQFAFTGFHPDMIRLKNDRPGLIGVWHSSIACYGWMHGLSTAETTRLFCGDVFEALGFFSYYAAAVQSLLDAGREAALPLNAVPDKWTKQGVWMYTVIHPKLYVLADVTRAILARDGISFLPDVEQQMDDHLVKHGIWPVYPEIARRLGVDGSYQWAARRQVFEPSGFVEASFKLYATYSKEDFSCVRLESSRYKKLADFLTTRPRRKPLEHSDSAADTQAQAAPQGGRNPYQGLADYQFWRRAMERVSMRDVDPVVRARFTLKREDKVATAGSCFAQHISRTLVKHGFNYYIPEDGAHLSAQEAQRRNYGVFSARYGNLYTTRQLVQLFDRAYGTFKPEESSWVRRDGRLVDPFRSQIEPDGFATLEELKQSRSEHLRAVREMFENLDVFVFTFGLTEAWRSRIVGAAYPLAPGVVAGEIDLGRHEFVNFGAAEVTADMQVFIDGLRRVNPGARIILTVSPVPLIATYEDRHVLVSTTYSKSVLRVAAEEISVHNSLCAYFPSYEIITGNYTRSEYYESDLRSVKPQGVDHVMRLFIGHYSSKESAHFLDDDLMRENAALAEVVCDEDAIEE